MRHDPKMIYNPTGEKVEVFSGGELIQFAPGESRIIEGNKAHQILTHQNSPLQEVQVKPVIPAPKEEPKSEQIVVEVENLPYQEIRKRAMKYGVWEKKMNKNDMILAVKTYEQRKANRII